jgi:phosphate transport system substrate-binding protein
MEETLAIATLLSGQADAAFVHRRPSRFELAAADSADGALLPIVLATDALAFVPPRGATTGEWSLGDLRTMLLAEGGDPDGRVQSLAVAADSSTWSSIGHDLTGGRPVLLPILSLADDAAVARIAGKRPGVASLTPVRLLRGRRAVSLSDSGRALAVPTDATSAVGWPLLRPLYVVTCGPVPGKLHAVMEYARSPEGQRLAEEAGWLPAASWSEGT